MVFITLPTAIGLLHELTRKPQNLYDYREREYRIVNWMENWDEGKVIKCDDEVNEVDCRCIGDDLYEVRNTKVSFFTPDDATIQVEEKYGKYQLRYTWTTGEHETRTFLADQESILMKFTNQNTENHE